MYSPNDGLPTVTHINGVRIVHKGHGHVEDEDEERNTDGEEQLHKAKHKSNDTNKLRVKSSGSGADPEKEDEVLTFFPDDGTMFSLNDSIQKASSKGELGGPGGQHPNPDIVKATRDLAHWIQEYGGGEDGNLVQLIAEALALLIKCAMQQQVQERSIRLQEMQAALTDSLAGAEKMKEGGMQSLVAGVVSGGFAIVGGLCGVAGGFKGADMKRQAGSLRIEANDMSGEMVGLVEPEAQPATEVVPPPQESMPVLEMTKVQKNQAADLLEHKAGKWSIASEGLGRVAGAAGGIGGSAGGMSMSNAQAGQGKEVAMSTRHQQQEQVESQWQQQLIELRVALLRILQEVSHTQAESVRAAFR